jgi:arylsulfatase A-like enzyme
VFACDLCPTLLDAAQISAEPSGPFDGLSLSGVLKRPAVPLQRDALYFHYPHYYPTTSPVSAIRQGDWKLLEYFEDDHVELYDLSNDPGEAKNLATARPQMAEQLRTKLRRWRAEVGALEPEVNPNR